MSGLWVGLWWNSAPVALAVWQSQNRELAFVLVIHWAQAAGAQGSQKRGKEGSQKRGKEGSQTGEDLAVHRPKPPPQPLFISRRYKPVT
jgi:hypothetical protein